MRDGGSRLRRGAGLALVAALGALPACTYLRNRGNDAKDILDVGFTWTDRPNFSFYLCGLGLATIGGGHVDGYFVGAGGEQIGVTRHYERTLGLVLWSYEEFGWGKFDVNDPKTLDRRYVGLLGWLFYPNRAFAPA